MGAYVQGIWLGMMGGTVMQTVILIWITIRTDWGKEVNYIKLFLPIFFLWELEYLTIRIIFKELNAIISKKIYDFAG